MIARPDPRAGMTLIELVISIGLVAVITMFSWMTIDGAARVAEESNAQADLHKMGRNAIDRMRMELSQAFLSPSQNENYQTVFKGTDRDPIDEVYFVARAHEKRYANVKEADHAEYQYWSVDDINGGSFRTLMHREAPIIDEDPEEGGVVHAMCHSVRELNLRYYNADKEEWMDEWDTEDADFGNRVPDAVEIRLELEDEEGRVAAYFTRTELVQ
jgi:general secretion pathway protein J